MSAEDVLRQRALNSQTPAERQLRASLEMIPQLWTQLEAEAKAAIPRLESRNWPGGALVQAPLRGVWNNSAARVDTSGEWRELAVWAIWLRVYTDGDGSDTYDRLYIGSDGALYQSREYSSNDAIDSVSQAPFEYFYHLFYLHARRPNHNSVNEALKALGSAIDSAQRLGN